MKPLFELDPTGVTHVLFDIDDTLTTEGKLTAGAYSALERLKNAGKVVVPITGRPAGWCDHIARMWPVDAVVGENGAFYFWFDGKKLNRRYGMEKEILEKNRSKLKDIAAKILAAVPGCALASDHAYRETDLAIDFCEDVPALPLEAAERIAALMREAGLTARVSSIHVNGWLGDYDKLAMTRKLFAERFSMDLEKDNRRAVFIGDSPNDEPMFAFFENSIAVANVGRFRLVHPPKFVTLEKSGAGFEALAAHLAR